MKLGQTPIGGELVEARERLGDFLKHVIPQSHVPEFLGRLETLIDEKIKLSENKSY